MIYKRKIADTLIKYLELDEILVLHGARQVGKTHILYWLKKYLEKKEEDTFYIDLEDSRNKRILDLGVDEFIDLLREEGHTPPDKGRIYVFIDEIQYLKNPSEFLKLVADHYKNIKLVVSGSSSFEIRSKFKDSLVGRTMNFEIYGLSFEEFLMFRGFYYESDIKFTAKKIDELKLMYKEYVLFGGYPKIALTDAVEVKERRLQQIIDTYVQKDIRDLAKIDNIESFNKLLEALASQSGQMVNITELANTCNLSKPTIEKYLFILEQTYIIRLVRPYHKNIRSEISKTPKVFFFDTGLMQMLWLKELQKEMIGEVFETSVFSEFVKKYKKDNVYYWRTKDKKEIDFIIKNKSTLMPYEVKLSFERFNSRAISYFSEKYKTDKGGVVGVEGELKNSTYFYPWNL
jgi:uncharacterized protein